MKITRRQFLQYCTASAAALGLSQMDLLKLEKALADVPPCGCHGAPHVIWLQGQSCGGCTLSILNRMRIDADLTGETGLGPDGLKSWTGIGPMGTYVQDVVDLLVGDAVGALTTGVRPGWAAFPNGYICLDYQSEVMAGAGDLITDYIEDVRNSSEGYFVALSGAVPLYDTVITRPGPRAAGVQPFCVVGSWDTGDGLGKRERSITEVLEWLAVDPNCLGVVAFGTCASYGGIPAARGNPTGATGAYNFLVNVRGHTGLGGKIINVPGCAPHPDWMISPIAYYILTANIPPLDTDVDTHRVWVRGNSFDGPPQLVGSVTNDCPNNRARAIYTGDKGYGVFCEVCPKYSFTQQCTDLGAGPGNGDGTNQKEWCTRPEGCNGYMASPDCPTRRWNNFDDNTRNQWCVGQLPMGSNYVCQGCAEVDFPDGRSPFFREHS